MRRRYLGIAIVAGCIAVAVVWSGCAQEEPAAPGKPVVRPTAKPVAKPAAKPVAKPAAKPVARPVAKPAARPVAKPVARPAAKPARNVSVALPPTGKKVYMYTVVKGDTDFKVISRKVYNHASTSVLIAKANPKVKEKALKPGTKLVIPMIKYKGTQLITPKGCTLTAR